MKHHHVPRLFSRSDCSVYFSTRISAVSNAKKNTQLVNAISTASKQSYSHRHGSSSNTWAWCSMKSKLDFTSAANVACAGCSRRQILFGHTFGSVCIGSSQVLIGKSVVFHCSRKAFSSKNTCCAKSSACCIFGYFPDTRTAIKISRISSTGPCARSASSTALSLRN